MSAPLVQLDAAVIVGNSGGLLFTLHARLVGIVAAHERIAESIAFALPVDHVRGFLRAITAEGGRRSGALGVQLGLDRDVPKPSLRSAARPASWSRACSAPSRGRGHAALGSVLGEPRGVLRTGGGDLIAWVRIRETPGTRTSGPSRSGSRRGRSIGLVMSPSLAAAARFDRKIGAAGPRDNIESRLYFLQRVHHAAKMAFRVSASVVGWCSRASVPRDRTWLGELVHR